MKITKYLTLITFPALLLAVLIIGFSVKENAEDSKYKSDIRQLKGTSEFFYKIEGDTRVWHVLNTYSSQFSKDAPEYNVSEYLFTSDSVIVKNNFVGIDRSEFIEIIRTN